jgi:hypothetical protein
MATRSTIAIELKDGTVHQVYCHWDGYPSNNGRILLEHYTDEKKILELLSHGDMSSLGEEIGEPHEFGKSPNKKWTEYYRRDRGESGLETKHYRSFEHYKKAGWSESYDYIYRNGVWYVNDQKLSESEELYEDG